MSNPSPNPSTPAADHLAALSESFRIFEDAAMRFPATRRHERPRVGAFSATEILWHMIAVEDLWRLRISNLLTGGDRTFIALDPDADAADNSYNDREFEQGIETFRQKRSDTCSMLGSLTEDELQLTGMHSKYGEMTIHNILEKMTSHDAQHAGQLDRTARELAAVEQA
jgi:uncharacterized damage-inducible protein DinB